MTIYYSATTNAFYDSQVYNVNNIPEDKVAVAESTYKNLMAQQCAGRVIVAAADGTPTTIVQTCGPCTSTKYATKTELANGLAAKANDSNVVHKTGDEHINGVKSFGSVIKATNGTVQVGADTGYSVTFNHNGNITSKQARGTYNIFFPEGSGTLALTSDIDDKANDNNVVHKTGNETIAGDKAFTNTIFRTADITTSTAETVYKFTDTNTKPCGSIYNRMHWHNNDVYNRHLSFNATSGKDMYLEILSHNDGSGVVNTGGSVTNNKNLTTVTNATNSTHVATMGWVNNPATSTNVVHRSGDETIAGVKTFSSKIVGNLQGNADTATSAGNGVDSCGGSWIRFKNGIQMCWGSGAFEEMISYPKVFNLPPKLSCTPASSEPQSLVVNFSLKTNTLFACRLWNVHTGGWQANGRFDWVAIGTWK